jgi:hypothetical protein
MCLNDVMIPRLLLLHDPIVELEMRYRVWRQGEIGVSQICWYFCQYSNSVAHQFLRYCTLIINFLQYGTEVMQIDTIVPLRSNAFFGIQLFPSLSNTASWFPPTTSFTLRRDASRNRAEKTYHSPCSNPWYEPMEESRGSLLKPILGAWIMNG